MLYDVLVYYIFFFKLRESSKTKTRATKMVYGVEPDLTREGGSIPVTLTLQVTFVQLGMMLLTRD